MNSAGIRKRNMSSKNMRLWMTVKNMRLMTTFALIYAGHQCFEKEEDNDLLGIAVKKIKEDCRDCVDQENVKCEMCEFTCSAMKDVKEQLLKTHRHDHQLECWKCDKKVKQFLN